MADPICRWRNVTIKQVCEFTNILPHCAMPKTQAHEIINKNWMDWDGSGNFFKTAYQLAVSLGLYYEDDTMFYPRFSKALSFEESRIYLNGWMRRYYVPNPYTASVSDTKGIFVLNSLLLRIIDEGLFTTLKEALEKTYDFTLGNEDIISNMLNMFSDIDVNNEGFLTKKGQPSPINITEVDASKTDKKAFFEFFNNIPLTMIDYSKNNNSRQIIYYGAPGTGKSHEVKKITGELEAEERGVTLENVFRTTFHPDTDYASFVGCYKPTMVDVPEKYKAVAGKDSEISYEFVPQTFTDAYVYAYNHTDTATYLVIEEINRGNCAQIFGDLFQLLDRKGDGTSEYRIKADKDLAKHLIKELKMPDDTKLENVKLCLPANLHILATMNTSDQSLFPMDSAFKRRWDWEYVPISYTEEKSSAFEIEIGGEKYSWVAFIEAVNKRIFDLTQSEDKEMGNFFIKSSVDERQFKSKVMFYLWNEVLRDEVENSKYFFYAKDDSGTTEKFTFKDLYGDGATKILQGFMRYLGVEI